MSVWQSTESVIQFSPLATILAVLTLIVVRLRWLGAVPTIVLSALAALAFSCLWSGSHTLPLTAVF